MSKRAREILKKAYDTGYLSWFDFSILMQELLIHEGGYVLDTGSGENVNAEVALRLADKIKQHSTLWEIFFMVG